jgi:hypothetical protein
VLDEARENKVERAVFLGDYDTPEVVRGLCKLRIPKKFVVGNHDWHYIEDLYISGPTMSMPQAEYTALWNERKNSKERKFISDAMDCRNRKANAGVILEDKLCGKKVAYAHASLVDHGSPDSDAPGYVWGRMYNAETVYLNFMEMMKRDYWIFFRGHDPSSSIGSIPMKGKLNAKEINGLFKFKTHAKLSKNRRYIITLPAFCEGGYAFFDTRTREIVFKDLGFSEYPRGAP